MSTWPLRGRNYLLVMIMLLEFDHVLVSQEVDMAVNKSVVVMMRISDHGDVHVSFI